MLGVVCCLVRRLRARRFFLKIERIDPDALGFTDFQWGTLSSRRTTSLRTFVIRALRSLSSLITMRVLLASLASFTAWLGKITQKVRTCMFKNFAGKSGIGDRDGP
jgi:hypothetical protein